MSKFLFERLKANPWACNPPLMAVLESLANRIEALEKRDEWKPNIELTPIPRKEKAKEKNAT